MTVSTGLLLTRRNGKQLVSGNSPNINFPKVKKDKETNQPLVGFKGGWGVEFRSIVQPHKDWTILGADAKALEFRMLGHWNYKYDSGILLRRVMEGDVHQDSHEVFSKIRKKFGSNVILDRNGDKANSYGYLYGGGSDKLGRMNGGNADLGMEIKESLVKLWGVDSLISELMRQNDKFDRMMKMREESMNSRFTIPSKERIEALANSAIKTLRNQNYQ